MKRPLVYLAIPIGLVLALIILIGALTGMLPILFLLFISEAGFLLCLIGAFTGWRRLRLDRNNGRLSLAVIVCALMAVGFMLSGFSMWPAELSQP